MTGNSEAKTSREFKAPAEQVFDAWLDPARVRSWSALPRPGELKPDIRRVEIAARVGGKFTFSDMREDGEAVHWGYYREIARPRRLVFTWFTSDEEEREDNSTVTLTIEPLGDGCRATVVHSMDARWADYVAQTEMGWSSMLRQIDLDLEQGASGR